MQPLTFPDVHLPQRANSLLDPRERCREASITCITFYQQQHDAGLHYQAPPSAAAPARPALDSAHSQTTIRGAPALAFATELQVAYPSAGCHLQAPGAIVSLCIPRPNNMAT